MYTQPDLPMVYVSSDSPGQGAPLVLLLHGYGANEHDLFDLHRFFRKVHTLSLRAPLVLATASFAWFDLAFTTQGIAVDPDQARKSVVLLNEYIQAAIHAFAPVSGKVILVGFSQGASMAALTTLHYPEQIQATAVISGIVAAEMLENDPDLEKLQGHPFFVGHGQYDQVVPVEHGRATKAFLQALPVTLEYHEYKMAHEINQNCLIDLTEWLAKVTSERVGK